MQQRKSHFWDYFLLTSLVAVTGFPYFNYVAEFVLIGFLISIPVFLSRRQNIDPFFVYVLLAFMIIEVLHFFSAKDYSIRTLAGTPIRLAFAYFVVKILGTRFMKVYTNIILFFAVISFMFFGLMFIPQFNDFFLDRLAPVFANPPWFEADKSFYALAPNCILYTYTEAFNANFRNAGPFWEPGAFAVFLNIALIFHLVMKGKLRNWTSLILITGIVTTVSTAGYIILFFILTSFYLLNRQVRFKFFYFILVIGISSYLYYNLEFLRPKVINNIEMSKTTTTSRFGSGLADWETFLENPVMGTGRTGQASEFTIDMHRNNGLMNLLATYGIIIFLIYIWLYYKSFLSVCRYYNSSKAFAIVILVNFLLMGFSQGIFMRPFFYGLLFISLIYKLPSYPVEVRQGQRIPQHG